MKGRRWTFTVHDARGRRHRGIVSWLDEPPQPLVAPRPPARFHIILLQHARTLSDIPERVAICMPGSRRLRIVGDAPAPTDLPEAIDDLVLPLATMHEFNAGVIAMAAEGVIEPADVFPAHSAHPRLDRLALALIEAAAAEAMAPFTAVIRHELGLPPGTDTHAELAARLAPDDADARPPARAPATIRLKAALHRLQNDEPPRGTLEQLTADLRFLAMFAPDSTPLSRDALERLLSDVQSQPAPPVRRTPGHAPIVPFKLPTEDA